jgi:uncharacterized SAM-binding protein YcdF (DUF218 family)
MFLLIKLIKPFFLPPTLIALGMLISFVLFLRKKQGLGRILLVSTLAAYYLLSIEPVSYFLTRSLEGKSGFQEAVSNVQDVKAIVILAGGVGKKGGLRPFPELGGHSWRRLWHGIELYRRFEGRIPILYSGGSGDPFDPVPLEAALARSYAVSMSIPEEKFWIETTSRNTYESGAEVKRILDNRFPGASRHKIILVTSALHMPRSVGVMKKAGLQPVTSPADFTFGKLKLDPLSFMPRTSSFAASYNSIHEWVGMAGYKLLGKL